MDKTMNNTLARQVRDAVRPVILIVALGLLGYATPVIGAEGEGGKVMRDGVDKTLKVKKPPLGWNSYDCLHSGDHDTVMANLEAFAKHLQPHGYEYFVIDIDWFKSKNVGHQYVVVDEYGRLQPSKTKYPHGLKPIADRCKELGIKFGVWYSRGVPIVAVEKNTPIKGTPYFVADIADKVNVSNWYEDNYGVDMSKPGAQAYYDSIIEMLTEWGVDFVKFDDMLHKGNRNAPELEAVALAIQKFGGKMVYSLSPGGPGVPAYADSFENADMVRCVVDVWDKQISLDRGFLGWQNWQGYEGGKVWPDLDMIAIGALSVKSPRRRLSNFTRDAKETFMAQRAMAASPLFMGGDLTLSPQEDIDIVIDPEMLACNQNAVMGRLIYRQPIRKGNSQGFGAAGINIWGIDVWHTPHATNAKAGWLGVFNRDTVSTLSFKLDTIFKEGAKPLPENATYKLYDIWKKQELTEGMDSTLAVGPNGVRFIKYEIVEGQAPSAKQRKRYVKGSRNINRESKDVQYLERD